MRRAAAATEARSREYDEVFRDTAAGTQFRWRVCRPSDVIGILPLERSGSSTDRPSDISSRRPSNPGEPTMRFSHRFVCLAFAVLLAIALQPAVAKEVETLAIGSA